jgi:hypothetical protein
MCLDFVSKHLAYVFRKEVSNLPPAMSIKHGCRSKRANIENSKPILNRVISGIGCMKLLFG